MRSVIEVKHCDVTGNIKWPISHQCRTMAPTNQIEMQDKIYENSAKQKLNLIYKVMGSEQLHEQICSFTVNPPPPGQVQNYEFQSAISTLTSPIA